MQEPTSRNALVHRARGPVRNCFELVKAVCKVTAQFQPDRSMRIQDRINRSFLGFAQGRFLIFGDGLIVPGAGADWEGYADDPEEKKPVVRVHLAEGVSDGAKG